MKQAIIKEYWRLFCGLSKGNKEIPQLYSITIADKFQILKVSLLLSAFKEHILSKSSNSEQHQWCIGSPWLRTSHLATEVTTTSKSYLWPGSNVRCHSMQSHHYILDIWQSVFMPVCRHKYSCNLQHFCTNWRILPVLSKNAPTNWVCLMTATKNGYKDR